MRGRFLKGQGMKMRVFIADDSKLVVERLADLVSGIPGVELIGQADDVPEAVRRIQELGPDAVIVDFQMPGGNGLDILRAIRPQHPDLSIVVWTNFPYPQYREQCINAGANFFLDKSVEFEKIPAILSNLIAHVPNAALANS
jgi:DNA-binding NarL/FixJ family response regulator